MKAWHRNIISNSNSRRKIVVAWHQRQARCAYQSGGGGARNGISISNVIVASKASGRNINIKRGIKNKMAWHSEKPSWRNVPVGCSITTAFCWRQQ